MDAGKRQADAQRDLGWSKATASHLWNGKQRYTQDHVDEVAQWLGIEPFELLMEPSLAKAMRAFREAASVIAAANPDNAHTQKPQPSKPRRGVSAS